MSDSFSIYTFFAFLGCLLVGLGLSWLLYRHTQHLDKKLRYCLAIARAMVITLILFLLFVPLIRSVSYNLEKPVIVIGQDNSLSIGNIKPPGFNARQYQKDLQALAAQLSAKYEVKIYNFGDSVRSGFDFKNQGKLTNGAAFVDRLNDELLNRNVGAVIMASDGIFNRGGSPLYDLNKLKAPVYTIALGDTIPKKDIMVNNVNHNDIVYLDNEFLLEVQVQAFQSKGEQVNISILEKGAKVYGNSIKINSDAFVQNIPVKLKANKLGLQKYTVKLSALSDEISERNNTQNTFVEVIDARQKVLIAASGPHPDITALRQAITLNKHYELKVVMGEELNSVNLTDYSLVILYQMPSMQNDAISFLAKLSQSNLSVWYILGAQSNLVRFNQIQNQVSFSGNNNSLQEAFGDAAPNFTAFNIDEAAAKQIGTFDPLLAPMGKAVINGDAAVALNQRIGKIKTPYPQLFFITNNARKTGFLVGEGLWRWKLAEAQEGQGTVFNTLISNTVQYLSVKDDKRKFKVYTAKNTFDENEHVLINAVLYNDSYVSTNTPDVTIQVKDGTGKVYNYLFSRTEAGYELDAGTLPAGSYTYLASTTLGVKKYTAQGMFYINSLIAEFQQTIANHQLLNTMSMQTNGKLYQPKDLLNIANAIGNNEQIKTLSYEDRKYEEMINFKWLFVLILSLLSLEWFFRKRNGEI